MAAFVVSTSHDDNDNHKPLTLTPKNYSELPSFKTPVHERTRYIISDLEKFDWQRRRYHIQRLWRFQVSLRGRISWPGYWKRLRQENNEINDMFGKRLH